MVSWSLVSTDFKHLFCSSVALPLLRFSGWHWPRVEALPDMFPWLSVFSVDSPTESRHRHWWRHGSGLKEGGREGEGCRTARQFCSSNFSTQVNLLLVTDFQNEDQFQSKQKSWQKHVLFNGDHSRNFLPNVQYNPDFLLSKLSRRLMHR